MLVIITSLVFVVGTVVAETNNAVLERKHDFGIIGGNISSILEHPYQVSITYNKSLRGSGVVINKNWIITTASLLAGFKKLNQVRIRTKSDQLNTGGSVYRLKKVIYHPLFSFSTMDYDVALLRVKRSMKFDDRLGKIQLSKSKVASQVHAVVSGWGANSLSSYVFNEIMAVDVQIVNKTTCHTIYEDRRKITDRMFCAVSVAYGPCWGDNGDPLVYNGTLYGLMSWNKGCFAQQYPTLYTNISAVRPWIMKTLKQSL